MPVDAFEPETAGPSGPVRRARLALCSAIAGLAALAALLPVPFLPSSWAANGPGGLALVQACVLVTGSVLVWGLLGWAVLVGATAGLARLPGSVGQAARCWLARMAPAATRRALVTAVGASLLAGTAAGAVPAAGGAIGHGGQVAVPAGPAGPASPASPAGSAGLAGSAAVAEGMTAAAPGHPVDRGRAVVGRPSANGLPDAAASGLRIVLLGLPDRIEPVTGPQTGTPVISTAGAMVAPPSGQLDGPGRRPTVPGLSLNIDWPTGSSDTSVDVDWPTGSSQQPGGGTIGRPVVVLRGDSLWSIAKAALPAGATDAEIETAWHAWYAANRGVIGGDPNLILPGQRLLPPATDRRPPPSAEPPTNDHGGVRR